MPVTALYAGILAPLFVFLAIRVIGQRRSAKVALGDGGDPSLLRAMRVQANSAEYVPFALLLLAMAESVSAPLVLLHVAGATLVAGRAIHAYGVSQAREKLAFRVTGMAMTFTVILVLAVLCVFGSLSGFDVLGLTAAP